MKFSVGLPTGFEGLVLPIPFARPQDFVRLAQASERLGYDSVWGNDHLTAPRYVRERSPGVAPNFYEVMITLAAVAASTTRLRIGTALLVLPMRDPVWVAKQAATLDQLSQGRFVLGAGIGAYREEFEAWGPRRRGARRGEMFDEALAVLHKLFSERSASHTGKFYAFEDLELSPKPMQQPFPIFVGGHNLENVRRAARWGSGWLPGWRPLEELGERIALLRQEAAALGRDPRAIEVAPQFSVTLGKTLEEAARRHLQSGMVAHRRSLAYGDRASSTEVSSRLIGPPDLLIEKVARFAEIGVDHCCALIFPVDTVGEMLDQMQWFAESVMSRFR